MPNPNEILPCEQKLFDIIADRTSEPQARVEELAKAIQAIELLKFQLESHKYKAYMVFPSIDRANDKGWTPLLLCASLGDVACAQKLMDADNMLTDTALLVAAQFGQVDLVRLFLKSKIFSTKDKNKALMEAAGNGHVDVMALLLNEGGQIEVRDSSGNTLLNRAAFSGQALAVKFLLQRGAMLEAKNTSFQQTPLASAARGGHPETVKVLLAAGARLDATNADHDMPLALAAERGHVEVVNILSEEIKSITEILIEIKTIAHVSPPDINAVNKIHKTALALASEKGHTAVVKSLLAAGASQIINHIQVPLLLAIPAGHFEAVQLLSQAPDAPLNTQFGKDKYTPLHTAVIHKAIASTHLLLDAGANTEIPDDNGMTPLTLAAHNFQNRDSQELHEIIKLLLAANANKEATDRYHGTAQRYIKYTRAAELFNNPVPKPESNSGKKASTSRFGSIFLPFGSCIPTAKEPTNDPAAVALMEKKQL